MSGPVKITYDDSILRRRLTNLEARQMPFAVSHALNTTAKETKDVLQRTMPEVFDRPTPFTMRSLYTRPSTKARLYAEVWIKDFAPKGTPAVKYLEPEVRGGARRQKRFERALQARGLMAAGQFAVMARGYPKDPYGNIPGPTYVRILSQLRAFGEQGYSANETAAGRKRRQGREMRAGKAPGDYFALAHARGRLKPGIYERRGFSLGAGIRPVFRFVQSTNYPVRYPFFDIAKRVYGEVFPDNFVKSFNLAMITAR